MAENAENLGALGDSYNEPICAGFEIKATKAEILSLINDEYVKLVCSMNAFYDSLNVKKHMHLKDLVDGFKLSVI